MANSKNKTPLTISRRRNEKSCDAKGDEIVGIELVARIQVVAVDVKTVVAIVSDVEHVRVTVRRNVRYVFCATTP